MHTMRRNLPSRPARTSLPLAALTLSLITGMAPPSALADADITFKGTLVEQPPCVINDGELITVDFGSEVMTTRIDGRNYTKIVSFSLDCSAAVGNAPLKLRVAGTKAGFAGALDGLVPGLGIALTMGGQPLMPNEWQTFSSTVKPVITAVPVKDEAVTLDGGSFRVLASLEMEYQ